jgi:DNA-3-methyladenine glycosylase II
MSDDSVASLHRKARRHLARHPVLKALIAAVGDCTLRPGGEPFPVLVRSIVAQLISTAAARTISARLEAAVGPAGLSPDAILALGEQRLREQGLSGAKARAILDLAARSRDGTLPLADLGGMPDERVVEHLTAVRGIGVWTAEMFLIFCLGRPDILPVGDMGLRAGVQEHFGLEALPRGPELIRLAESWRPYRSIATWYVWRSRGFVPQSEAKS